MYLTIKTDSAETELALLDADAKTICSDNWQSGRQLSDQLLNRISSLLELQKIKWEDLAGIAVFAGPGSFTGLRIGATTANTIAYAKEVPVAGETGEDWRDKGVRRLLSGANDVQVVPHYGAEPNISKPKK